MAIDNLGNALPPLTTPLSDPNDPVDGPQDVNPAVLGAQDPAVTPLPNVAPPPASAPKPNATPLDRPKLVLLSQATSLSVDDLIELIQAEIHKTSEALSKAQNAQTKQDSLRQQAANTSQIEALKSAADQIVEIQKEQEAMAIANWCMMAFSIFMTVCTAGTLGAVFGPLMVAVTVVTQVPIEGKNFSGWLTEGIGKAVGETQKAILNQMLKDKGIKPTPEEMDKLNKEIESNQDYYAMAIMITIEVAVAIVIAVATFGAGGPEAASGGAEAVTETAAAETVNAIEKAAQEAMEEAANATSEVVQTVVKETAEGAEKAAQTATQTVTETATQTVTEVSSNVASKASEVATETSKSATESLAKLQKAYNITETIATTAKDLAMDGASIHTAVLQEENTENLSNADKTKAFVKFLQQILKADEDFLKELIDMQSKIADTTKSILQTEHSTNMHIANLTTNA